MKTRRTARSGTLVLVGLFFSSVMLVYFPPRCELGTSAVHNMTHWISFSDISTPVNVRMLISAESRPYLQLLNATYNPTPTEVSKTRIHFHPGDVGQEAIQVTWTVDRPTTVYAKFQIATYKTRYVTPVVGFETSKQEALGSTQFYPVEDLEVHKATNEILGSMGGVWRSNTGKAKAVYSWLRENIRYDMRMVGVHNPIEVLRQRRAVCEGLAYTFATLSRALGVPARVFYGNIAAASPEYELSGIFWQKHAWAEFWDGSNWQPADPTLDDFGSLSIKPYVHTSFGLWDIHVYSEKGMVWPVNRDSRITVSGCGLDWIRFIKHGTTAWVFLWMIANSWTVGAILTFTGGMYLGGRLMLWHQGSETLEARKTQSKTLFSQGLEDNYSTSSENNLHDRRSGALLAYRLGRRSSSIKFMR